jgi:hypothetical protein
MFAGECWNCRISSISTLLDDMIKGHLYLKAFFLLILPGAAAFIGRFLPLCNVLEDKSCENA